MDCHQSEGQMVPILPAVVQMSRSVSSVTSMYSVGSSVVHMYHLCQCTYMFPGDGTHIINIFNLSFVLDHPNSNGILTDLRSNVTLQLEA